jgi:glycyl-tRNA synthetase beta chain
MVATETLVVELCTEELPPKALKGLGEAFAQGVAAGLRSRDLLESGSTVKAFATPRRLAVRVDQVRLVAPDAEVLERLMPRSVAIDAKGQPSIALTKKLAALGRAHLATASLDAVDGADRILVQADAKGEYVCLRSLAKGQPLERGLQEALNEAVQKLPIPKVMRYAPAGGYYSDIAFVRPAHSLLALHGEHVVPVRVLGLDAGRLSAGHRFLSRGTLEIRAAGAWEPTLEAEGKVIPSFAKRREAIVEKLEARAGADRIVKPDALLDEVTALVEWPAVYEGRFDEGFLAVPQECLILTMQQNQKYFALTGADGAMRARFLVVSNLETRDPRAIVAGNERVLRARLADARFFYDQDRRSALATRVPRLASVVYHQKLGSLADRVARLRRIAAELAPAIGAPAAATDRAAELAKADLLTDMVGEFPELQGTMGRYYALHDGEPAEVADAIAQHYWPRFAGDALPEGKVAQAVALADKLESLAGMFGIGQVPTGDKDPYGLRRAAIGVLRLLVERRIEIPLATLVRQGFDAFAGVPGFRPAEGELVAFLNERLRGYLRDQGASAHEVEALIAGGLPVLTSLPARLAAVQAFQKLPEADALSAANKRIVNILRKSGAEAAPSVDRARLADGAERDLWAAFEKLEPEVAGHCERGAYAEALRSLATAKPVVDRYFDEVMVMADDAAIRANRLALLGRIAATMNRVADLSRLAR